VPCGSGPTVLGTAPPSWCGVRLSERRKSLSLVQGQSPGMGSGPPVPAIFKMGARVPVPYGVGDTVVSDILMVNRAGVIDVY